VVIRLTLRYGWYWGWG